MRLGVASAVHLASPMLFVDVVSVVYKDGPGPNPNPERTAWPSMPQRSRLLLMAWLHIACQEDVEVDLNPDELIESLRKKVQASPSLQIGSLHARLLPLSVARRRPVLTATRPNLRSASNGMRPP